MENENTNPFATPVSKSEFSGFWIPSHNAKVMKAGLDTNKVPFLSDQNGKVKGIHSLSVPGEMSCFTAISACFSLALNASRTTSNLNLSVYNFLFLPIEFALS